MHHIIINHAYAIVISSICIATAVVFAMLAMNMSNPVRMLVHLDYDMCSGSLAVALRTARC